MKDTKFVEENVMDSVENSITVYEEDNSITIYEENDSICIDSMQELPEEFIKKHHKNAVQTEHRINTSSDTKEITDSYKIAA